MEIRKPQLNASEITPNVDTEQASAPEPVGFTQEDLVEVVIPHSLLPDTNPWHSEDHTCKAQSVGEEPVHPEEVSHRRFTGPHFDLGLDPNFAVTHKLREAHIQTDLSNGAAEEIISIWENEHPETEDLAAKIAQQVEALKHALQESVESAIHPIEDWFD